MRGLTFARGGCDAVRVSYRRPMTSAELNRFWNDARAAHASLPSVVPEAWAFGATPAQADDLLALVLEGVKTGTASSLRDYEADAEPIPAEGDVSIVLDGDGDPRAVLEVTAVDVVPFRDVTPAHARAEGEDDRTLASWRRIHETFWRTHSPRGFAPDMPVVCERFRVVHAAAPVTA